MQIQVLAARLSETAVQGLKLDVTVLCPFAPVARLLMKG